MAEAEGTFDLTSRRYGRYRVRSRLGSGGMAEVFLADIVDEHGEERSVALKLMRTGGSREAFAAEADLMGLLQHPNLVERLEVGEAYNRPFIAMEFLVGGDLAHLAERVARDGQAFPLGIALHIGAEVLKGLAHFHQLKTLSGRPLQLVHGDVTPANILFAADGAVKLTDFGVANSGVAALGPQDGAAAGKLHYLSPEQIRGEPLTGASDLFSLGVVLYELIVGQHPFHPRGGSKEAVLSAMRTAKFQPPATLDRTVSAILKRALQPELKSRFHSAGEMAGVLTEFLLDADLFPGSPGVKNWLSGVLDLLL